MELWMIYALMGSLLTGLFGIFQKIETENPIISRDSFIFYAYLFGFIINVFLFFILDVRLVWDLEVILISLVSPVFYTYVLRLRHNCLEYMSSSSYFINYRIFTSIGLLIIGSLLFGEYISFREYIGIGLGFIIFYLLLEKSANKNFKHTNMTKGYMFLGLSVLLAVLLWGVQKYATLSGDVVWTYLLTSGLSGTIFMMFSSKSQGNYTELFLIPSYKICIFLIIVGATFGPGHLFHLYALFEGGDVAIVYKIISYSLFFPIIFSIMYYKEPVTWKKIIAFILTILSIGLFI